MKGDEGVPRDPSPKILLFLGKVVFTQRVPKRHFPLVALRSGPSTWVVRKARRTSAQGSAFASTSRRRWSTLFLLHLLSSCSTTRTRQWPPAPRKTAIVYRWPRPAGALPPARRRRTGARYPRRATRLVPRCSTRRRTLRVEQRAAKMLKLELSPDRMAPCQPDRRSSTRRRARQRQARQLPCAYLSRHPFRHLPKSRAGPCLRHVATFA